MLKLDPAIVENHIDTWPNLTPVHQNLRPFNPSRLETIKDDIDKLKEVGFIYPIEYTTSIST